MIDLAILGLLKEQDLHGYELRKQLGELLGSRLAVSFGSIYPALAKLERNGSVKAVTEITSAPSAPMSGSLEGELAAFRARGALEGRPRRGGRGKKVYGITDVGRERLHELLTSTDVSDRDFPVQVAFCHHLTSEERLALFERRRDELLRRRERRAATPGDGGPGQRAGRINRYLKSLIDHDTEVISADVTWLDQLIETERALAGSPHEREGHSAQ